MNITKIETIQCEVTQTTVIKLSEEEAATYGGLTSNMERDEFLLCNGVEISTESESGNFMETIALDFEVSA